MPIMNEQEEFAIYMLEDHPPSLPCERCLINGLICRFTSWGRSCWSCEHRLDDTCYLMQQLEFESFAISEEFQNSVPPFGRDRYKYRELWPFLPRSGLPKRFLRVPSFASSSVMPIAERVVNYGALVEMLTIRKPRRGCAYCRESDHECTFVYWTTRCRKCEFLLNTDCDYTKYEVWTEFRDQDTQRLHGLLARGVDYALEERVTRWSVLEKDVANFFRASNIIGVYHSENALANLISRVNPQHLPALISLAQLIHCPAPILDIMFRRRKALHDEAISDYAASLADLSLD
ncbi:hypothetical protein FB451DRAFT_1171343 [Mycena latifolia]|nr:hypothetical protein FB451DRAFT_1171343 [Mycena latifolia]